MSINPIQGIGRPPEMPALPTALSEAPASGGGFQNALAKALEQVNTMQLEAGKAVEDLVLGKETDINRVASLGEQAGVAFETTLSYRNKAIEAYKEVQNLQF